ncbi:copper resistance B family protein [Pseudomonas aeruginosa]|nr:copper resistance B family protein [Pseudomonas aeruginosa]
MVGFRIQGLAPYWFELEATATWKCGRTALRVEGSYELLLTQRLILEPRAELQFMARTTGTRYRQGLPKRLLASPAL